MRARDKKAVLTRTINKLFQGSMIHVLTNTDKTAWRTLRIVPGTFTIYAEFNSSHGIIQERLTVPKFTDYIVRNNNFEKMRRQLLELAAENTDPKESS